MQCTNVHSKKQWNILILVYLRKESTFFMNNSDVYSSLSELTGLAEAARMP